MTYDVAIIGAGIVGAACAASLSAAGLNVAVFDAVGAAAGSTAADGFVCVDDFQTTSCENIYCAGEPTGIGGVEAAVLEGKIAGFAAVEDTTKALQLLAARKKTGHFAESLNVAFALRDELKTLADAPTIVCRCEDVEYSRLTQFSDWRDAKLQTRCGMGPCQGRICGAATEILFNWKTGSVRPPIFPVKLENL